MNLNETSLLLTYMMEEAMNSGKRSPEILQNWPQNHPKNDHQLS